MIALIDIGHTRLKFTMVSTKKEHSAIGIIHSFKNELLNVEWLTKHFTGIEKIIIASVASKRLTEFVESWCHENKIECLKVESEKTRFNVCSGYKKPSQLGVDRWLALLASAQRFPQQPIIVIDAGTATTIDLMNADGQHLGGWILAGIDSLFDSVTKNTSKVHAKISNEASLHFGLNSSDNVNNACWAATIGTIQLAITLTKSQFNLPVKLIITGGNAKKITKLCEEYLPELSFDHIDELIFYGLQRYI